MGANQQLIFLNFIESRCYVSLFLSILKVYRQIFSLDTFGRQADEYITRGVVFFFNVFYVFMFAYMDPLSKH
jgi:hypothetical protein